MTEFSEFLKNSIMIIFAGFIVGFILRRFIKESVKFIESIVQDIKRR